MGHDGSVMHRENDQDAAQLAWQNTLRYSTSTGTGDEVFVHQGTAKLHYGFEYLGLASPHVVMSAATTQQTCLGLVTALNLHMPAAIVGTDCHKRPERSCLMHCTLVTNASVWREARGSLELLGPRRTADTSALAQEPCPWQRILTSAPPRKPPQRACCSKRHIRKARTCVSEHRQWMLPLLVPHFLASF